MWIYYCCIVLNVVNGHAFTGTARWQNCQRNYSVIATGCYLLDISDSLSVGTGTENFRFLVISLENGLRHDCFERNICRAQNKVVSLRC